MTTFASSSTLLLAGALSIVLSVPAQALPTAGERVALTPAAASVDLHAQRPSIPPGQAKPVTPPKTPKTGPPTGAPAAKPMTPPPLTVKPALVPKLTPLLPPGTDINAAAQGFKNLGQFVASVHVSHNLTIPFDSLKSKIVDDRMSLGDAIHALKPEANAKSEASKATKEANEDLKGK